MIPITITPRTLTCDEETAVEDALSAAAEWDAGRLPLKIALMQGGELSPHRARGLAFRLALHDPRIPALERLSETMSTGNGKVVLANGGMLPSHVKNMSDFHVAQARKNGVIS
jgi:hypothetical protein